jgi:hypothetical protein
MRSQKLSSMLLVVFSFSVTASAQQMGDKNAVTTDKALLRSQDGNRSS